MSKKKKSVVRCVCCGLTATKKISVEPVCENIVCHEAVKDYILAVLADEKMKNK